MEHKEKYIYVICAECDYKQGKEIIEALKAFRFNVYYDSSLELTREHRQEIIAKITDSACVLAILSDKASESNLVHEQLYAANMLNKQPIAVYLDKEDNSIHLVYKRQETVVYDSDPLKVVRELKKLPVIASCRSDAEEAERRSCMQACETPPPPPPSFSTSSFAPIEADVHGLEPGAKIVIERTTPLKKESFEKRPKELVRQAPPVRKKSFGEKLSALFGKKTTDISFSVLAPDRFKMNEYTIIDIYAFEEEFRHIVERAKIERTRREGEMSETDGGCLQIRKGTKITVVLESDDVRIKQNTEQREWAGKYVKFDFAVLVPSEFKGGNMLFTATVYFDNVLATRINFTAYSKSFGTQYPKLKQKNYHSAFISYASDDRKEVALVLQGMRRSRPDLEVFFDIETLQSGENWENKLYEEIDKRDVLYLFWSQRAKESEWVEREWRYALETKGLSGIEPMPLVKPKDCPPPQELCSLHFGAKELFYQ